MYRGDYGSTDQLGRTPRGGGTHACSPPFDSKPWCSRTLPLARRSELLVAQFTLEELISQMSDNMPAISRLGVPAYHYGYEALRGVIGNCPFSDRCFTSFPCSSAAVQSFNRTLCECGHGTLCVFIHGSVYL
jgi:hypothetical protein